MLMKRLRWQILVVVVTLVLVGILLLSQGPVITPILPQAASGGVYTEGLVGAMGRLNPMLDWNNSADRDVNRLIYSGVMRFDARGMPEPDLAESWGTTADGTIYNFSLRPNAVWHDGSPVISDDIIFTIELMKSPASFYPQDVKDLWSKVEIIRLNDKALQFKIPEPYAPFLDYMTFGVLPKHLLESIPIDQFLNAEFNLKPIGSGPFKFDHLLIDNGQVGGVVLVRNEQYHLQKPFVEQVIFKYYSTSAAALDAFQAGEVAGISRVTDDVLPQALAEPNLSIYTSRLPQMGFVLFNLSNPEVAFLQEAKLRRALLLGLNRQRLIDAFMQGQAIPLDGPILPGSWAHYDGVEKIPYDADMAIALLKELGYTLPADGGAVRVDKDGKPLAFSLVHPDDDVHTKMAQSIQENWAKIGVQANLIPVPYASLQNDYLVKRAYQAALVELALPRTPDPDPYPFWHQAEATGGQNYSQWDNRSASEYLEQARVTTDFGLRARLYRNFQVIFARELPSLPLYVPVYSYGVNDTVQGMQMPPLYDPSDRFLLISQWYLVTRRALETTPTPAP
ncbi:MAG: peptide ABC transporter substrate-binding protein [Anaerolineaceae bacterium]|nr:MAG: peptide ABC transporter substrate-binding protein [Anaerolineaceae bacterium]